MVFHLMSYVTCHKVRFATYMLHNDFKQCLMMPLTLPFMQVLMNTCMILIR